MLAISSFTPPGPRYIDPTYVGPAVDIESSPRCVPEAQTGYRVSKWQQNGREGSECVVDLVKQVSYRPSGSTLTEIRGNRNRQHTSLVLRLGSVLTSVMILSLLAIRSITKSVLLVGVKAVLLL